MGKKISISITVLSLFSLIFLMVNFSQDKHGRDGALGFVYDGWEPPLTQEEVAQRSDTKLNRLLSQRSLRMKGRISPEDPGKFAQYHRDIRTRADEETPSYAANYRIKELLQTRGVSSTKDLHQLRLSRSKQLSWVERGPGNVSGRTRGLLVDPGDPNYDTWYAGSASGGVWKTEDAGQSWTELTADVPNFATHVIAWSTSNPNTIYAGTGEYWFQVDGAGIWKTTDAGVSWNLLPSTMDFENVTRIIVDPSDENTLLATTMVRFWVPSGSAIPTSKIVRSPDGGVSWATVYEAGNEYSSTGVNWFAQISQIVANPQNFNTQYAAINGVGVVRSHDGGQTWSDASAGLLIESMQINRMELAIAPTDTSRLYISAETFGIGGGSGLFVSDDGGDSWTLVNDATGRDPSGFGWLLGQGFYDNAIAVHPFDKDKVFVAGVDFWRLDMAEGTDTLPAQVLDVFAENTESFISFVGSNGSMFGGGGFLGENFFGTDATAGDYTSVEVRFGPGKSQKAHRFDPNLNYLDYSDVGFEVWDTDNDRQLMVSYRDWEPNGVFDLQERATARTGIDREYLFISAIDYDAITPDAVLEGGTITHKNTFALWMEAPPGLGTVNPDTLTIDAKVGIIWGSPVAKRYTPTIIDDGRGRFGGPSPGVHVDHHNITIIPLDEAAGTFRIVNGNDGGVAFSDDGGATFSQVTNGYNTTQFYGLDKMTGGDRYVGGTQDNGSWVSPLDPDASSTWVHAPSGDGFDAVWHPRDPDKLLESSQFNFILRSEDGGQTWNQLGPFNGLTDVSPGSAPFFTKIAKSKQDPDLIFVMGASGIFRSDNFGNFFTVAEMPDGFNGTATWARVEISLTNPQIVWTGSSSDAIFASSDGGLNFASVSTIDGPASGIFTPLGRLTGFETHPTQDSTAFALFSFANSPKIFRTTDLGQTWEELSGFGTGTSSTNGFPDVAVYSLLVMPFNTDMLWAGTDIGIFESTDDGASWAFADNGFPAAPAYDLFIVDDQVVVGTHGRGIWSVDLPELAGYSPPQVTLAPRFFSISGGDKGIVTVNLVLPSSYDSSFVLVDGEKFVSLAANATPVDTTFDMTISSEGGSGSVLISARSYKDGATLQNAPVEIQLTSVLSQLAHTTDNVSFTLFNDGIYGDTGQGIGGGFSFLGRDGGTLFSGGFVSATSVSQVAANMPSFTQGGVPVIDFVTTGGFEPFGSDDNFDQVAACSFAEAGSNFAGPDIGLAVDQTSFSNADLDFVIVKLVVSNPTSAKISNLYVGQFADWDIGVSNFANNQGGYDANRSLLYQFEAGFAPIDRNYYGIAALSGASGAALQSRGFPTGADVFKFISSLDNPGPNPVSSNADYRSFIGSGPFDIPPGGAIKVGFAWAAGTDLQDLQAKADAAQQLWDTVVTVEELRAATIPSQFALAQNYPNPFNPTTNITYDLPKDSEVTLQVFNVLGQKVRNLVFQQKQQAGSYTVQWDGKDEVGRSVASGLYFYSIKAGDFIKSQKMTLLK
ncbi:MAG: T9SS type A sorting domain-containing protein [bacterium]